jgi:hypothetical protein
MPSRVALSLLFREKDWEKHRKMVEEDPDGKWEIRDLAQAAKSVRSMFDKDSELMFKFDWGPQGSESLMLNLSQVSSRTISISHCNKSSPLHDPMSSVPGTAQPQVNDF